MLQDLAQLKELVFRRGFDQESRAEVAAIEQKLHDAAVHEHMAENPALKPFIEYLQAEVDRCELLLKSDRTLTDGQRDELFARIDIATQFTWLFNGKQRESIEQTIKHMLHAAKTH